jgi:hypothetical protein
MLLKCMSSLLHSTKSFDKQQEKELIEQHNSFLNEELTAKVSALLEERHNSAETMADLRSKLAEVSIPLCWLVGHRIA